MRQLAQEMNKIYQAKQNHPQLDKVQNSVIKNKMLFIRDKKSGALLNVRCDGECIIVPKYYQSNLSFLVTKSNDTEFSMKLSIQDCGQYFTLEQVV